jgi:beta-glucosidase
MMLRRLLVIVLSVGFFVANAQNSHDPKMDAFIQELMSKMTLEEKLGQLNLPSVGFDVTGPIVSQGVEEKIKKGLVGGVFNTFTPNAVKKLQELAVNNTRLKIPLLFGYDVIHGHKTIFPINLGLAASWDMALVENVAKASAAEAAADGLNWVYSPMVDIARDPRWGRVSEGSGEDPYLGAEIAKAMVNGLQQGDLSKPTTVLATVKHFALYGAGEAGRDYNTVDMSRIRMFNEYFLPYKAAVDAGVGSVMTSFNEIEGVPASGNKWLLTDLLRKQWGYKGMIVSDYTSINEMMAHGMGDAKAVTELSLNAGMDMDMVGELFIGYGAELVKSGKVSMETIDAACRRILEAKYKLGLFKDPYLYVSEERAKAEIFSADKLALSKDAAVKSMVLLKNDQQILPLQTSQKVAFIGPLVNDQRNLIGSWSAAGDWKQAVSIQAALDAGNYKYTYAKGANLVEDPALLKRLNDHDGRIELDPLTSDKLIAQAVKVAKKADVVVAVLGEAFGMSGEAASRSDIGLPEHQQKLLKALKATGKPIVLVLMNGRPLTLSWEDQNMSAILETWFGGTKAGDAIVDILYGKANPSGKLSMTFPRSVGQIPIYYNHKNTGRPMDENQKYTSKYLDIPNTPLYAFGHGLSYTQFTYGTPELSATSIQPNQKITLTVPVTNSGNYDGEEVVQLYIQDVVGSVTRPVQELKAFKKVKIAKGQTVQVSFDITVEDLKFYNADLTFDYEAGKFRAMVGTASDKVQTLTFDAVK